MSKKKKNELTAHAGFQTTVDIPMSLFERIDKTDREILREMSVHTSANLIYQKYVFYIGDILKVRNLLAKYEIKLTFPPAKEMKRFGINYTGDSMEIQNHGKTFIITQYFPDDKPPQQAHDFSRGKNVAQTSTLSQ